MSDNEFPEAEIAVPSSPLSTLHSPLPTLQCIPPRTIRAPAVASPVDARADTSPGPVATPDRGLLEQETTENTSVRQAAPDALPGSQISPCSPCPPVESPRPVLEFFSTPEIARALQCSPKTVHRRAEEQKWPREQVGNGFHYCPGPEVAARLNVWKEPGLNGLPGRDASPRRPSVTYAEIANDPAQSAKVELRRAAVEQWLALKSLPGMGKELAYATVVVRLQESNADFPCSVNSLRAWVKAFADHGLNGLVEQKRGKVGRRGVEVTQEFRNLGKALTIERGSVARAARELASHPDLPAEMRMFLHGGHAAKSYVTPSIRAAINPAQATKDLIQGPRHARLHGRWTPGDYEGFRAMDYLCSDDMTSNVLAWCEWPNALGWRIGQAQILPVLDVRSLRWLNVRVIMRDGGQYNAADDIWGLFGDVFDEWGLPGCGFVLEGGHWQSNAIRGVRTGLETDVRIGGLESLGLQNVRSYDPRSKIIETQFNTFQRHMDRMPGWVGRDQRTDLPELVKKRIALFRVKNPQHHPKEFFPHLSQLADQVRLGMENQNHERQDGKVLRGQSPMELWSEHAPKKREMPDGYKWLYRSAMNVSKVTCNGVRVTRGSGPKMQVYYYDAPELLVPRQGTNVIIHWNDANPDADAVLRDAKGKFIGLAKHVKPLARFSATDEELSSEAKRKAAATLYARTESRAIQPDLVRSTLPIPETDSEIGRQIGEANARAEKIEDGRARLRRAETRSL